MKKLPILLIFCAGNLACGMEEKSLLDMDSLSQTADWSMVENLEDKISQPTITYPRVVIHHQLSQEIFEEPQEELPELIDDAPINEQEMPLLQSNQDFYTTSLAPLPQSGYRINELLKGAWQTISNSTWYQNKQVRYSALAGTGTISVIGIVGYLFLKNK